MNDIVRRDLGDGDDKTQEHVENSDDRSPTYQDENGDRSDDQVREASLKEGAIYQPYRPLDERNEKRTNNLFLKKLRNKREEVNVRIEGGDERRIKRRRGGRRWWAYGIGILVVAFLIAYAFFPSVSVSISPRLRTVTLADETFSAALHASGTSTGTIPFQTVAVTGSASTTAKASGSETVQKRATGELVVYNNFSDDPMQLIAHTRFESPKGLIYRVENAITIPGMKNGEAGAVTISVTADAAGADYNLGDTSAKFTIPGLKNDPDLYQGFYAKPAAPITGGYEGEQKTVSDADLLGAKQKLLEGLRTKLLRAAQAKATDESILFDDATQVIYKETVAPSANVTGDMAMIILSGTLEGITFKKTDLATAVAKRTVPEYKNAVVGASDWSNLHFSTSDIAASGTAKNGPNDISNLQNFSFTLTGVLPLMWQVPTNNIAQSLAGKKKTDFETILHQYYSIDSAKTMIRPFWKSRFPEDPMDIDIKIATQNTN